MRPKKEIQKQGESPREEREGRKPGKQKSVEGELTGGGGGLGALKVSRREHTYGIFQAPPHTFFRCYDRHPRV